MFKISAKDGALRVSWGTDEETYELKARDENHFRLAIAPVDFTFESSLGGPAKIVFKDGDEKPRTFEAVSAFTPTDAELKGYAGAYSSEEIDPLYEIALENGKLMLHRLKNKPEALEAVTRDLLIGQIGSLHVTRDAKGEVDGFKLNTGRILNMRFKKGRPAIAAR